MENHELDRRFLLGGLAGAAGISALAAMAKGGPLNPPAGSVAGTGRTLDEVYNKIPSVGGSDGRTPIPGGGSAYSIFAPGSYVLTGNISVAGTALNIFSSNVTVDLNGFRLTCTNTASACIVLANGVSNILVRNGSTFGGAYGLLPGPCNNLVLEDLQFLSPRLMGLFAQFSGIGCAIRRCTVMDAGSTTTAADNSLTTSGLWVGGNGTHIEDCTVLRTTHNGTSPLIRPIVAAGTGCIVERCLVVNESVQATSQGILMSATTSYRWNNVQNMTTKYVSGVDGGGNI